MSRFREEMNVVPIGAWVVAVVCYLGFVALAWNVLIPRDEDLSPWPEWGKAVFAIGIPLFLAMYILLIGYVNGDARRRGMRYVLWTLLAIFIPNAIGVILYFIMRERLMRDCPGCGKRVRGMYTFCPLCGTEVVQSCPGCRRSIEAGWSHCPSCGKGLKAA